MTDSNPTAVGVDACSAGWIATEITQAGVRIDTYERFKRLHETYRDATRILVDIPIGLPTERRRRCDECARDLLGCRGLSVFFPPSRSAIECDDYEKANIEHRASIGNGLSQQAFNIANKIQEVENVVGDEYDGLVREAHPELCFAALNGQPIAYSKSSNRGRGLRMKLLCDQLDDAEEIYHNVREEYFLKEVGRDDILDSMVLAIVARSGNLTTVPENPPSDEPRIYYPNFDVSVIEVD